ncbi:dTDP-4-dehydrorhamnose 3,5-epimerase [Alicyclobacillus sp. ALC3]|uniref:dTDP-4-dehydrorhamnose 3,5-epimerase n=1 Tax=Alicyclobacillus sp. ALC3 TaxID=2796143 RepID=UPI002379F558|nr:dTDP-4-dehydrorhamnose 3,5-epimerase [Alicyclobacillus sp. ALC3]WDL95157.1 dTDP-4-dehydrorhamnose 3,5-epimerase [Alicyclobacillus sp. ALC3]
MVVMPTPLSGAVVLEWKTFADNRGHFSEVYHRDVFTKHGVTNEFVQDNQSLSTQSGTLRGLHYQLPPKAQAKLIRVLRGAIYDVFVDLRTGSSTYGRWSSIVLTEDNNRLLLVPRGFAHGFCTLVPNTEVLYKVDEFYSPTHERGIAWNDPELGIPWPYSAPILSQKDVSYPRLREAETGTNSPT